MKEKIMNIELHIERVQSILDQMDLQKKCKFAAWCCNALIIEKKINENIEKANKCRFYFASTANTFKFFLEGDIESVINLQKIIDENFN